MSFLGNLYTLECWNTRTQSWSLSSHLNWGFVNHCLVWTYGQTKFCPHCIHSCLMLSPRFHRCKRRSISPLLGWQPYSRWNQFKCITSSLGWALKDWWNLFQTTFGGLVIPLSSLLPRSQRDFLHMYYVSAQPFLFLSSASKLLCH
jgi:hypothetical protein